MYKAMSWVQQGVVVLAFCWSHVRRDFLRVGKGWPELEAWAWEWQQRIRALYPLNDRRLAAEGRSRASGEADTSRRRAAAEMKQQMEMELARADLRTPCRKALESLKEDWEGVDPLRGRPTDPDGRQRLGTP
jgi:hypothetical protein